ncbi:unnamed protein product [Sphagnum jensenii]|uniref:LAGLIDADG homing endonuclease n=1 Tax=Sphagnum jensenii TaxID=128206 RepID=A0ABP0X2E8_9BRYO
MHEVFRVARLCYGRGKGMGSRATEKMRSEMMQAREKGLTLVKVWEWKKGSSKDLWVGKLPQGGNCRGSRYFGPETTEALQQFQTVAFHMTALIMLNIHSGELNDKIKDMYILIKGMFFLTIDLPWTAYGKGMRLILHGIVCCMHAGMRKSSEDADRLLRIKASQDDIYNKFIQTIREDSPEDMEEMLHGQGRDLLTGLLFSGHNTADTTVFTVKYVGENSHVLTVIRKEHENVIKLKQPGERLTWEECKAMSFTQDVGDHRDLVAVQCFHYNIQKSLEDVHVRGKLVIPKGWMVLPYFQSVHYDHTFYPKPYKFNP